MASYLNPRSIITYLSGICHGLEPSFPNAREARLSPLVKCTLRGALRSKGSTINQKLAIVPSDLRNILLNTTTTHHFDTHLFHTILLTSFFGLLHLGELTILSEADLINPMKIVC